MKVFDTKISSILQNFLGSLRSPILVALPQRTLSPPPQRPSLATALLMRSLHLETVLKMMVMNTLISRSSEIQVEVLPKKRHSDNAAP